MRFLKVLLPILVAFGLSSCTHQGASDAEYVRQAEAYFGKHAYREAAIELKNALQRNPSNAEARLLLGRFYLESGLFPGAEIELRKASQLGLSDDAVAPYLAQALLNQSRFAEVVKLAEGLLDRERFADVLKMQVQNPLPASSKASLLATEALAQLGLNHLTQAQWSVGEALKAVPDSAYALTVKGRLAAVADDLDGAKALAQRALGVDARYGPAWSLLGDIAVKKADPAAAEAAFTKAVNTQINNARDLVKRCLVRIDKKGYEGAQADISELEKRFPHEEDIDFLKGRLAFAKEDFPTARDALARSIEYRPDHGPTLFFLGVTQFLLGNDSSATTYLLSYLAQQPDSAATRKILAILAIRKGDYAAAERRLRPLLKSTPDDTGALTLSATALLRAGKREEALAALQRVVDLKPKSSDAQIRLGTGQYIAGHFSNAAEALEQAISLDPKNEKPYMLLTRLYLDAGKTDKAWEVATRLQRESPGSATAQNMLGSVLAAQGKTDAARKAFERAAGLRPGDPFANHELAQIALKAGDPDAARRYYRAVLQYHTDHLLTLLRLGALEETVGNKQAAVEALRQAVRAHPDVLEARLALAQYYLDHGDADLARMSMSSARERFDTDPRWLMLFGRVELQVNDPRGALITLSPLTGSGRDGATLANLRALAQARLGHSDEAMKELDQALADDPTYLPAQLTRVQLLFNEKKLAEADAALTKLKTSADITPEALTLEGRLAAAMGQNSRAEKAFRNAFTRRADTASVLALTQFLWNIDKREDATGILKQWVGAHPGDVHALVGLANAYRGTNRVKEAIGIYEQVLKTDSRNVDALNNIAWAMRQSDPKEALGYARRAYAVDSDSANVMDTLAVVAWSAGEIELATRTFARALKAAPDDPGLRFHRAQFLAQQGLRDQAVAELHQSLANPKPFSERSEAQAMLTRLSTP